WRGRLSKPLGRALIPIATWQNWNACTRLGMGSARDALPRLARPRTRTRFHGWMCLATLQRFAACQGAVDVPSEGQAAGRRRTPARAHYGAVVTSAPRPETPAACRYRAGRAG